MNRSRARGQADRIELPVAGDNADEKQVVMQLLDDSGFNALDSGLLETSWKQQPGSPVYCTDLNFAQLKNNINRVHREKLHENRELALQFIFQRDPKAKMDWCQNCVANNRVVFGTELS